MLKHLSMIIVCGTVSMETARGCDLSSHHSLVPGESHNYLKTVPGARVFY